MTTAAVGEGDVTMAQVRAPCGAGDAHADIASREEKRSTVGAQLSCTPQTSETSERRISSVARDGIQRPGGRPRRLLTGLAVCGRCGAQLLASPRTRHELRFLTGPTREPYTWRQPRYVCPDGHHLASLAEPVEQVIKAAVEQRLGRRLLGRLEDQRRTIAEAIRSVEVLPGTPGATAWDARRLRAVWADGEVTQGVPLRRTNPVPPPPWKKVRPEDLERAWSRWQEAGWQAAVQEAGAALAGHWPDMSTRDLKADTGRTAMSSHCAHAIDQ